MNQNSNCSTTPTLTQASLALFGKRYEFLSASWLCRLFPRRKFCENALTASLFSAVAGFTFFVTRLFATGLVSVQLPLSLAWTPVIILYLAATKFGLVIANFMLAFACFAIGSPLAFTVGSLVFASTVLDVASQRMTSKQFVFKPVTLSNMDYGSAKTLTGQIEVVHMFVSTSRQRPWRQPEIKIANQECGNAFRWLAKQANRFDVELNFRSTDVTAKPIWDGPIPESDVDAESHNEFARWLNQFVETEPDNENFNRCLIVHINQDLRSYAVPNLKPNAGVCSLEYTVVGGPLDARIYAHELLHLFGADDFYLAAYFGDKYQEHESRKQLLNKCIMFSIQQPLNSLIVDDLTAQKIGWC